MNIILIYLILVTIIFSVLIYVLHNHSIRFKAQSLKDIESDSADIVDSNVDLEYDSNIDAVPPIDYDIIIPLHDDKTKHDETSFDTTNSEPTLEMFYDSPSVTFPAAISKGDTTIKGRNCHWKMYKKPNYYGWGPWGKLHYGEPYYMKIRCEGDDNCSDDMSVNLNCLNKIN